MGIFALPRNTTLVIKQPLKLNKNATTFAI